MDLPFTISPSVSGLKATMEEGGDTQVELIAWYQEPNKYEQVRFTFQRAICTRIQSLIGEAGHGIGVVERAESKWLAEWIAQQLKFYPSTPPSHHEDINHYYFNGHDLTVEVLAESFTWTTLKQLDNW